MQRLEVSCVIRPLKGSLGFKGLMRSYKDNTDPTFLVSRFRFTFLHCSVNCLKRTLNERDSSFYQKHFTALEGV